MKNLRHPRVIAIMLALFAFATIAPATATAEAKSIKMQQRHRVETAEGSGQYHVLTKDVAWQPSKTAVVICDMWDLHHCKNATMRVGEMAPRMNEMVKKLRGQGVMIIHCPSDTMSTYANHPARKLAQAAPKVETTIPLLRWCHLDKKREGQLPIDDSDGGCDSPAAEQKQWSEELKAKGKNPGRPWTQQHKAIEIVEGDAITDSAEAFYLMKQRGIENVIVMGVHTNMCVLGRPFSIRQMAMQGQNVVLVRDMTDTMYNPAKSPFVSHFSGTDLVIDHIEKSWCGTITSDQIIGGKEFRFKNDKRKHIAIVIGEAEYKTGTSLTAFAAKHLQRDFRITFVFANEKDRNDIPGLEVLDDADLMLLSVRRRLLPKEQLDRVRNFIKAGKPVVAIRTASHAFCLRPTKNGPNEWPEFDAQVIGGHYTNHYSNNKGDGPGTFVWAPKEARTHAILQGVRHDEFEIQAGLYRVSPLGKNTQIMMMGRVGDLKPHEPVAWTNKTKWGGRVFYTSFGHTSHFAMDDVQRLLHNGVRWALDMPVTQSEAKKQ